MDSRLTGQSRAQTPPLESEQAYINDAYEALDAMRVRAEAALSSARRDANLTDAVDAAAVEAVLAARAEAVADSKAPLTFGRIAGLEGAFYIGRRHVESAIGDPVVVDWRAGVAAPFYRATWADSLGLDHRRRFALEARTLVGLFDEDFTDPNGASMPAGGVPDPLLAELDRARSGAMRDIVATIQGEQDTIIRRPLASLTIVQGGPGTGKTAVGLHRAAFLLYTNRDEFRHRKMLVVGPNRLFLAYIADVLPSLGETSVVQATVELLHSRSFPIRATDEPAVAMAKGDRRMATLLRTAMFERIASVASVEADGSIELMTRFGGVTLQPNDVAEVLRDVAERVLPLNTGREVFREQLVAVAWRVRAARFGVNPEQQFAFVDDLRKQPGFKAAVERIWPTFGAANTVRKVLGSPTTLRRLGGTLFDRNELALLARKNAPKIGDEKWTRAEVALLDEVHDLATGEIPQFGHVVIDEAQDLSAMELRMVARRSATRSLTVLGDLAQSTTPWGQSNWAEVLGDLGHQRTNARGQGGEEVIGRVEHLTIGYRVPERLISYANRLLSEAAPGLVPLGSVRPGGSDPEHIATSIIDRASAAAKTALQLGTEHNLVGVLAPASLLNDLAAALTEQGSPFADARSHRTLDAGVTLIAAENAKGLEFDAVVVVEPILIVNEHAGGRQRGFRTLFVALTRATQRVSVVHGEELPEALRRSVLATQVR